MTNRANRIQNGILNWYDENRRALPWRVDRTPYGTWISETMLQQTRVAAVIPYFQRFLALFPDIPSLASARTDEVYKAWEGLGYYSRANNLLKGARYCMEQENGALPDDYDRLIRIPGIGPYTAGAIASLAFGIPVPAVDGNVIRVFSRLYGLRVYATDTATKSIIAERVLESLPKDRCGDFNEAVMDIGATVCLPKQPKCAFCPVSDDCDAFLLNIAKDLPLRKKKAASPEIPLTFIVLVSEGSVYLRKRPEQGLLANLYEFLHFDGHLSEDEAAGRLLSIFPEMDRSQFTVKPLYGSRHIFSHVIWEMIGYRIDLKRTDSGSLTLAEYRSEYSFIPISEASKLPFATAIKAYVPSMFDESNQQSQSGVSVERSKRKALQSPF